MDLAYAPWNLATQYGNRQAIRDERRELTFADLDRCTEAVAARLADAGIGTGDVVGVMLPNRIELVLGIFAAWRIGAVVTVVNPAFGPDEAGYQLRDAAAKLTIATGDVDLPTPVLDVDDLPDRPDHPVPPADVASDDLAFLIYTSGSTGRPKGVMLDHANLDAMTTQMVGAFELSGDDHCMLVLPLFHANALLVSTLSPLRAGGQISVLSGFSPTTFFDHLQRLRPTYFSAVPTILSLLNALPDDVQPDTSSLRFVVCGAAPVSRETLQGAHERYGFEIVEGYGLTEATCASAVNPLHGVRKLGTVGPALAGQKIRIVDDHGADRPVGEPGEVLIAGPTVMRGYLNRPDETAATVVDGWLHTGDVGTLDDDGYLRIVDRIKDLIIRGGENLYPKEIENTIAALPGVLDVAVVGRPDDVLGEVPVAFVVPYPDADLDADTVTAHCAEHLTRVKVPAAVHLVVQLPKNPVGKIDKPGLRRELASAHVETEGAS